MPWGGRPCQPCTVRPAFPCPPSDRGGGGAPPCGSCPTAHRTSSAGAGTPRTRGPENKFIANGYTRDGMRISHGCPGRGNVLKLHRLATWRYPGGRLLRLLVGRVLGAFLLDRLASLQPHARAASVRKRSHKQHLGLAKTYLVPVADAQAGWAGDMLTRPRSTNPHQNLHGASRGSTRPQPLEPEGATRLRAC